MNDVNIDMRRRMGAYEIRNPGVKNMSNLRNKKRQYICVFSGSNLVAGLLEAVNIADSGS